VTLAGDELDGFTPGLPAASVRLLISRPGTQRLVMPTWNGNEFLFDDGTRPPIRTLTPLVPDGGDDGLAVEIVRHGGGALSDWVEAARPGVQVAVSGPGRGYDVDASAGSFLVAGDESALPAITVLLPALPAAAEVQVLIEVSDPSARVDLPRHPGATVRWCPQQDGSSPGEALLEGVRGAPIPSGTKVWAAGEAAGVQRIRRHLFEERGVPRSDTVVRGYWKHGRPGVGSD
jgi:NADPH-dependent ferric siderophore reductase